MADIKKKQTEEENLDRPRYSDAELEEFKQIILEKLDKAMRDYDQLKKSIQYLQRSSLNLQDNNAQSLGLQRLR